MSNNNHIDSVLICPVCGNGFINKSRGRTREYCDDECKNMNSFLSSVETFINKDKLTLDSKRKLKSRMFIISNNIVIPKVN